MENNAGKVLFIKTNHPDRDPRLIKELKTLKNNGYFVQLLCWDRDCVSNVDTDESQNECRFILKAPYGIGVLAYLPLWWLFEIYWLLRADYDVVHAINFDTIFPAMLISKIRKKRLIYEIYDVYSHMNAPIPGFLRHLGLYLEKLMMHFSDAVILVDESRIEEFNGIPNSNMIIVYNSPRDYRIEKDPRTKRSEKFTIFFAGMLHDGRSLCEVIEAVDLFEDVELIIAGFGRLAESLKEIAESRPFKIKFIGEIAHDEVIRLSSSADLLFSLYDPTIPLYKYASSNKLFEAMMLAKPILVSEGTAMENIVKKELCGLVVPCKDIEKIGDAILELKNNSSLRQRLGTNGRNAYINKYSWDIMEVRLLNLYSKILNNFLS